jgi:hypothetical protein
MRTPDRSVPPQTPQSHPATTRLDVAAYLLVRGFEISDVKLSGSTATFAFKDPNPAWGAQALPRPAEASLSVFRAAGVR